MPTKPYQKGEHTFLLLNGNQAGCQAPHETRTPPWPCTEGFAGAVSSGAETEISMARENGW